ncbi:hypothetical protein Bbelb_426540 [Branchiostoma belcheri]|nr:hypothetical protein Bbelb_426540 [Branchiostoma belcheri]
MLPNVTTELPGHQNSTANSTGVFDWEPFSYYYSPWRELQLVWVTICMTLGTCGNTAVLLTISSVEELRTPGNALLCPGYGRHSSSYHQVSHHNMAHGATAKPVLYICYPLKYSSIMTRGRTACLAALPLLVTVTNMVLVPFFEPGGGFYFFPPRRRASSMSESVL